MDIQLSGLSEWGWYVPPRGTYTNTLSGNVDSLAKSSLIYAETTHENTLNIFAKGIVNRDKPWETAIVETNSRQGVSEWRSKKLKRW